MNNSISMDRLSLKFRSSEEMDYLKVRRWSHSKNVGHHPLVNRDVDRAQHVSPVLITKSHSKSARACIRPAILDYASVTFTHA